MSQKLNYENNKGVSGRCCTLTFEDRDKIVNCIKLLKGIDMEQILRPLSNTVKSCIGDVDDDIRDDDVDHDDDDQGQDDDYEVMIKSGSASGIDISIQYM